MSEVGVCRCESGGNGFLDEFVKILIGNTSFIKFITSVWKSVSGRAVDAKPSCAERGAVAENREQMFQRETSILRDLQKLHRLFY